MSLSNKKLGFPISIRSQGMLNFVNIRFRFLFVSFCCGQVRIGTSILRSLLSGFRHPFLRVHVSGLHLNIDLDGVIEFLLRKPAPLSNSRVSKRERRKFRLWSILKALLNRFAVHVAVYLARHLEFLLHDAAVDVTSVRDVQTMDGNLILAS